MKTILLNRLMEFYINNFAELNATEADGGKDELFKWKAVQTFQKYWNLDIPDDQFKQMMENSFKDTKSLMNTEEERGLSNLIKTLDNKANIPLVRQAFRRLFEAGKFERLEIYKKSQQLTCFIETCNKIIEKEGLNKGKGWKWSKHTAIAILALKYPRHNCFFKYKEAKQLADYLDYQYKIYAGKTISLAPYESFCQELKKALLSNKQIMKLNSNLLTENNIYIDDNNNILVWDFINATKYFINNKAESAF